MVRKEKVKKRDVLRHSPDLDESETPEWDRFLSTQLRCATRKELELFLRLFLTPNERKMLGDRLVIIEKLLQNSESQRMIAQKLGISISKVTYGSRALQSLSHVDLQCLKKITRIE